MLIEGNCQSKANSRRAVPRRTKQGKPFTAFIKSASAQKFFDDAIIQLKAQWTPKPPLEGPVAMRAEIHYQSRRNDLDESLIMDALQKANVILNDRQIHEKHIYKYYDPIFPRVEVSVRLIEEEQD